MEVMNLQKLFQMQKVLRERIGYNEPDRFNKLILALLVELGECSNEWRGFKFWSKDQKPRTRKYQFSDEFHPQVNPLLEEYVDGLHFVLELGIELVELEVLKALPTLHRTKIKEKTISQQFKNVMRCALNVEMTYAFSRNFTEHTYKNLLDYFIGLGEMLGFTWDQIELAYFKKNSVNHQRQEQGY